MGAITGKDMRGDRILPFWLEQGIKSSLRDTEEDIPVVSFTAMSSAQAQRIGSSHIASPIVLTPTEGTSPATSGMRGGGGKGPFADLDKFYADEEDEDGEEDEDTDEEEEDGEEESNSEGQPGEHEGGEEEQDEDDDDDDDGSEEETEDDESSGNPQQHA